jgi:hypothetical protein
MLFSFLIAEIPIAIFRHETVYRRVALMPSHSMFVHAHSAADLCDSTQVAIFLRCHA